MELLLFLSCTGVGMVALFAGLSLGVRSPRAKAYWEERDTPEAAYSRKLKALREATRHAWNKEKILKDAIARADAEQEREAEREEAARVRSHERRMAELEVERLKLEQERAWVQGDL